MAGPAAFAELKIIVVYTDALVTGAYIGNKVPVYSAIFSDMRHLGFTDMMFFFPVKSQVGKLPADIMHRNLCGLHVQFFDKYIKGKDITISAEDPDNVNVSEI